MKLSFADLNEVILFLCRRSVLRFLRKLRSETVEIELPERSKCSR